MLLHFLAPFFFYFAGICPLSKSLSNSAIERPTHLVIIGDSLVAGTMDFENRRGFVGRLREELLTYTINDINQPGGTSVALEKVLQPSIYSLTSDPAREALDGADIIILSMGTNDLWRGTSPFDTAETIRSITSMLRLYLLSKGRIGIPIVPTSLVIGEREHRIWLGGVNEILETGKLKGLRRAIPFDVLVEDQMSEDRIHPSAKGYNVLADVVRNYLFSHPPIKAVNFTTAGSDLILPNSICLSNTPARPPR